MLGVIGIILSLGLLMYLAYRGINVLDTGPDHGLAGRADRRQRFDVLLPTYTQIFMKELGGYLLKFFPSVPAGGDLRQADGRLRLGQAASPTGSSTRSARIAAILAIVLSCGILTYGGVSLFVVAFAVYPIGAALFREVGMPKRFIPGAIALGSFTFTMTAFPGTPAIQNAIPAPFFGTNTFAAPGLGTHRRL
jgi:H+/gluconate symporter-like permease